MRKQYVVHKANESLYMRMKWGFNTFYMRCWLKLLWHSQSCCHTLCPSPWYILEVSIITSSNFVQSLSNHPRSETILFGITVYTISVASTINISSDVPSFVVLFSSKIYSSVILNDLNISSNISMPVISWLSLSILSIHSIYYNNWCLVSVFQWPNHYDVSVA